MADDPMDDRAEYDEPVELALCPDCGSTLKFCDPVGFPNGPEWFCPGCEDFVEDAEVPRVKNRKLCRWCGGPIDMEWYRASVLEGRPPNHLCRDCFEEDD